MTNRQYLGTSETGFYNIQERTEAGLHLVAPQSYKAIKHHLLKCFYIIHNNQSHLYTKKTQAHTKYGRSDLC